MAPAAELVAFLGLFLAFLLAWMILQGYRFSLGLLLHKIEEETRSLSIAGVHPFGWLADGIGKIDHYILYSLGLVVQKTSLGWHKVLAQMASFIHETMSLIADLAEATYSRLDQIASTVIPGAIGTALGPLWRLVYSFRKQLAALAVDVYHLPRTITHEVTHQLQPAITKITKITRVTVASAPFVIAGAIGIPLPRVGRLETDLRHAEKRIADFGRRVAPAAIVSVVAASLAKLGLSWARCSRTQKWDKSICGMDDGLLESLVSDTLLILGTVSLVEFAQGMQDVTAELAPAIRFFWRA